MLRMLRIASDVKTKDHKKWVGDRLHSTPFQIYIMVNLVIYGYDHFAYILYHVLYTQNDVKCSLSPTLFFMILCFNITCSW
uniref:Cas1_AcylT domain-containing protein n=1 Tax=Strongyloides venezuelensis TaxID=75913 RepID=A0A0K0FQA6_STRVS